MAVVARYLLDEADSGTGVSTVIDNTGDSTNDMGVSNASNGQWLTNSAGRGVESTQAAGTSSSLRLSTNALNTTGIGTAMDGTTQGAMIVAADITGGASSGGRIFSIADVNALGDFAMIVDNTNELIVRWDRDGSGGEYHFPAITALGYTVFAVSVDTTQPVAADRIKVWYDGVEQTATVDTALAQNTTLSVNDATTYLTILNRRSANRNPTGPVYYAELRDSTISAAQAVKAFNALSIDNDSDWDIPTGGSVGKEVLELTESLVQDLREEING